MNITAISDLTLQTLHEALRGIDTRRQAITDNIANANTPGYLANRVDFESSLKGALASGDPAAATVSTSRSLDPTQINGNNVKVDDEFVSLTETQLRQQLVVEAMNAKYRLLRTAIQGS